MIEVLVMCDSDKSYLCLLSNNPCDFNCLYSVNGECPINHCICHPTICSKVFDCSFCEFGYEI